MDYTRYNNLYTLSDKISKDELAGVVSKIIMDEYEGVLIERCVKNRYGFLEPGEQQEVINNAKELAKGGGYNGFPSYEERLAGVKNAVRKYLNESESIVPCGFVDFRMREEYYYTEDIAHMGADQFFERKEYEEFTYLLGLFVDQKESREEVIHVIWHSDGIRLLNKRRRDVTEKYEREFIRAAKEKGVNEEDLAISAVIAAAPEELVLHSPPHAPLGETLQKIFGVRCSVCNGCNICKKS